MRVRLAAQVMLVALVATGAQAQTKLMTYDGAWMAALEAALPPEDGSPAVALLPYDGSLAALDKADADMVDVETGAANVLCDQGPALPMPPAFWAQAGSQAELLTGTAHDCGIGYLVTSLLLVSSSDGPRDWIGFFDTEAHTGTRALPRGARGTLEIALMGDGVAPENIYATLATDDGMSRALAALDALAAQTQIIFWDTPADAAALMATGAVDMAAMPNVQAALLAQTEENSARVSLHFSGQIYQIQRLLLLSGTAGQADALRVMARVLAPDTQAALALSLQAGPVNADAYLQLTGGRAALLPTAPVHRIAETGLADDADFWALHGDRLAGRFHGWLEAYEGSDR